MDDVPQNGAGHTAIWTGTEMLVWGGRIADYPDYDRDLVRNRDGVYDPRGLAPGVVAALAVGRSAPDAANLS